MPARLRPQKTQWFFMPYQQPRAVSIGSITSRRSLLPRVAKYSSKSGTGDRSRSAKLGARPS
jgi:hypothetical protein